VLVYDDRVEIWNPGELPKQLTPDRLKEKHRSFPRNKFLAEKLYLIKYIERWGTGTTRVVEAMREEKLSDPVFEELSGGLNVTLIGPGKAFEKAIDHEKLNKIDLNDRQKKALDFVKEKGTVSRKQYTELTMVSLRQANDDINDLIAKRVFRRIGSGSLIRYELAS
jgi:ATP-dependent DNA helicase RecG